VVTKTLFKKYKDARDFANADLKELEQDIKPTGFYHNKAKILKKPAKSLSKNSGARFPTIWRIADFTGSGRKTQTLF